MTQTQNPDVVKNLLSFSSIEKLSIPMTDNNFFRITKKDNKPHVPMELPVNNYLKSPEEIEKEFLVINSHKAAFNERQDDLANSGTSISKSDSYMSIHNLEATLSGFMEENY